MKRASKYSGLNLPLPPSAIQVSYVSFFISGEDHSKWVYHPWLPGGMDSAREVCWNGAGCRCRTEPGERGASSPCGLLLWKSLH